MITFQYYRAPVLNTKPQGIITLNQFIKGQKEPKQQTIEIFHKIEEAAKEGNEELKAQLKQTYLYYFTPCVEVKEKRNYESINSFTGIGVLDFDKINHAEEFRDYLFQEYMYIITAYCSPSKKGVKALVSFPMAKNIEDFKKYFWALEHEMTKYEGFDYTGQNPVLPLFQSYDPELLYRENYSTFADQREFSVRTTIRETLNYKSINVINEDKYYVRISNMVDSALSKINDAGHPILRSISVALGGYVANNFISFNDGYDLLCRKIETHNYLRKKAETYKKTAKTMMNYGLSRPLIL